MTSTRLPTTSAATRRTYGSSARTEQGFYGWIGDVRIVDRPLPIRSFMTA
jgi:hypothetical protein